MAVSCPDTDTYLCAYWPVPRTHRFTTDGKEPSIPNMVNPNLGYNMLILLMKLENYLVNYQSLHDTYLCEHTGKELH